MQPSIPILTSAITNLSFEAHVDLLAQWARQRESRAICVANVHMVMEAYWSPEFAHILKAADLVTPDGMPLVWVMRRLGAPAQDRVAGMDLLPALCARAEAEHLSIYFFGSTPEVLKWMRQRIARDFPDLAIAGMESPPFRPLSDAENEEIAHRINESGAHLVFVALGCPKQERWIYGQKGRIHAPMIGLGGAFPVYAGMERRAPRWAQRAGLEWAFRMLQDPKRLWRRYVETNFPFLWLAARQLYGGNKR